MCWLFYRLGWQYLCLACVGRRNLQSRVWLSTVPDHLRAVVGGYSSAVSRCAPQLLLAEPAPVPAHQRLYRRATPACFPAARAVRHWRLPGHSAVPASENSRLEGPPHRRVHGCWWAIRLWTVRGTLAFCPALCPGGVLMDADNRGIAHGVCIVGRSRQMCDPPFPDAACRPAAVAAVHSLPIATPGGQSAPRNARPVTGNPCLPKQEVVFGCDTHRLCPTRKPMRDLLPLTVPQSITSPPS
jgi:hypothetical protein